MNRIDKQISDINSRILDKEHQLEDTIVPSEITKIQKVVKKLKRQREKLYQKRFNKSNEK